MASHIPKGERLMADAETQPGNRTFQPGSDVHVTREDQAKINQFAKCNAKSEDIKMDLIAKQNLLQNLEDACEELVLLDDDTMIPYQCGEIFVYMDMDETNKTLEAAKNKIMSEIRDLKETGNELKTKMSELKAHLYSRLGNRINLEDEEEE